MSERTSLTPQQRNSVCLAGSWRMAIRSAAASMSSLPTSMATEVLKLSLFRLQTAGRTCGHIHTIQLPDSLNFLTGLWPMMPNLEVVFESPLGMLTAMHGLILSHLRLQAAGPMCASIRMTLLQRNLH